MDLLTYLESWNHGNLAQWSGKAEWPAKTEDLNKRNATKQRRWDALFFNFQFKTRPPIPRSHFYDRGAEALANVSRFPETRQSQWRLSVMFFVMFFRCKGSGRAPNLFSIVLEDRYTWYISMDMNIHKTNICWMMLNVMILEARKKKRKKSQETPSSDLAHIESWRFGPVMIGVRRSSWKLLGVFTGLSSKQFTGTGLSFESKSVKCQRWKSLLEVNFPYKTSQNREGIPLQPLEYECIWK